MIQKLSFFLFLVFQKLNEQAEKINDMIGVMQSAIKKDDSFVQNEAELFSRLKTENQGLKELLEIANHNGSLRNSLLGIEKKEKEAQTEDDLLIGSNP